MKGLTNRQFITLSLIVMFCGLAVLGQDSFKTGKDMAYDNIALAYSQAEQTQNTSNPNNTNLDNNPNNLLEPNNDSSDDSGDAEDERYDGSETEGDESSYSYNTGDTSRNVSNSKRKFKYIGWIKIPKMGLYKGFLANKKNNLFCVDYNICAYNWEGNSPRHENSKLVIGAHNGVRNNAYFRGIEVLKKGDIVYIEYKGKSYKYKLIKKYKSKKSKGSIKINPGAGKSLYLFTCAKENHYMTNYLVMQFKLESESSLNS